jgi:YVTN family beta-propeller protein
MCKVVSHASSFANAPAARLPIILPAMTAIVALWPGTISSAQSGPTITPTSVPGGPRVYVTGSHTLSVLDAGTNALLATVPLPGQGWDVAVKFSPRRVGCSVGRPRGSRRQALGSGPTLVHRPGTP